MRTLIFGTSYCVTQERRWLCEQWHRTLGFFNPNMEIRVVDSASPFLSSGMKVFSFPDNIGHLQAGGADGWGRALCKGIEFAIEENFEWVVHVECDVLLAAPVLPIIDKMRRSGVKVAAPIAMPYGWIETALLFMNVDYVRDIDFIGQYDWPNSPQAPLPERRCEEIFKGELFGLTSLKGMRNDLGHLTPATMDRMFPDGISWLTHANTATMRAFMKRNGVTEA